MVWIKKLSWEEMYYRLRIGDYRVGFSLDVDEVVVERFLHRKDIYKVFP